MKTNQIACLAAVLASFSVFACNDPDSTEPSAQDESALSSDLSRDAVSRNVGSLPANGTNCREIALLSNPIVAMHLDDPMRQQTAGRAQLASYGAGKEQRLEGVALATIVGKRPSGELLGNHHFLFAEGTLRTQNDIIAITPTENPCIVDAKVKLFFVDGSGSFAGLSGEGVADAKIDFCGGVGRAPIYARLCQAGK